MPSENLIEYVRLRVAEKILEKSNQIHKSQKDPAKAIRSPLRIDGIEIRALVLASVSKIDIHNTLSDRPHLTIDFPVVFAGGLYRAMEEVMNILSALDYKPYRI